MNMNEDAANVPPSDPEPFNESYEKLHHEETDPLFPQPKPQIVGIERPIIRTPIELVCTERSVLKILEAPGLLGRSVFPLDKEALLLGKESIYSQNPSSAAREQRVDGIFTQGPSMCTSNTQRLEQRLLRSKQVSYFNRTNKELRMCSDVTTHHITKPTDMSLEHNPALDTKTLSAVFSHRTNSMKSKYYRLDLHIGNFQFTDHDKFVLEDILAAKLTQLYNEYERRALTGLVSHLTERLDSLDLLIAQKQQQIEQLRRAPSTTELAQLKLLESELDLLQNHRNEAENSLNDEKSMLQDAAQALYEQ